MDNAFDLLHGAEPPTDDDRFDCQPVPDGAPKAPAEHFQLGETSSRWAYRDHEGRRLGYFCRFDQADGGKEFRPLFWGRWKGKTGWHWKAPDAPRPLYNLPAILERPDALVIVTEGEKSADAAAHLFPDLIAVSPMNGAKSPAKADWAPLAGRHVVIWPDHDESGEAFGQAVPALCHEAGAESVRVIEVPASFLVKWDLANDLPEGWTVEGLLKLIDESKPVAKVLRDVEIQNGFRLVRFSTGGTKVGVYRLVDDGDNGQRWEWFCSLLEILADTRDVENQSWGRWLRVTDRDGVTHDWPMPMAMLAGDGADYRRQLFSLGLDLAPGRTNRDALQSYINVWQPDGKARCVDRIGWNGHAFVLPDIAIGNTAGEHVLLQTTHAAPRYAVAGSLEDWCEDVVRLAAGNSRLVFGLSSAFAGPLLHPMGEESGGFHVKGGSSIGKTTILRVAVSAWGNTFDGWRTTDNAAEGLARDAADALLCLDEIGQAESRAVEALAYMLGNERGKARMKRDGTNRQPITWRVLFLSTGEIGLADKLGEHGRRARAGQEVRVVEIPADAGQSLGVFETLHGFEDGDRFARHLKEASERNKGQAARVFLERLIANYDHSMDAVVESRKRWLAHHLPENADGQVRRVAGRFALVAAAGELAASLGVLPWEPGEANWAAATCFKDWLSSRGGHGPAEQQGGLRQVRLFLEQHGSSRFEDVAPVEGHRPSINRAGFRRKEGDAWDYLIMPEVWRDEICKGFDPKMIAKAMIDRGWMVPGDGKNLTKKESLPGIGQTRVYVIKSDFLTTDDNP
ncbi:MAG: DUF927 domain-containing protein [Pseudomonadota bacterium]